MSAARNTETLLSNLAIGAIRASATNPRKNFDAASMAELTASIAASGIQVPLLVRPMYDPDDGELLVYELVAGERRLRAATELGLFDVPCIVREMTDAEARETQIIENLQRADVHPLEEAEAFGELLGRMGSIPAVALKLGKEQSYIAKCLRLLSLTVHSRDALRHSLITIEHGLLLARLAEAEQDEALKWTLDHSAGSKTSVDKVIAERLALNEKEKGQKKSDYMRWRWEPQSIVQLRARIESEGGVKLSRAPWSLDADNLSADAEPCDRCDKNTKANAPLFGDLDMGDATCTDGACFAEKTATFVHIAQAGAGHNPQGGTNGAVPRLSWKSSSVKPAVCGNDVQRAGVAGMQANPAKLLKYGQWIDAKPGSCPNVRPGVTADWSDSGDRGYMGGEKKLRKPGEVVQVCIALGCKVHKKGYEGQKALSVENGKTQQEREAEDARREKLEKQIASVEPKVRTLIFQAIVRKLGGARALRIANDSLRAAPEIRKSVLDCLPQITGDELEMLTAFGCVHSRSLSVNSYYMARGGVADDRADLWKLAKQAGVDPNQIAAKAFHDGLTPSLECLYPKGVKWPKVVGPVEAAKVAKKAASSKKVATKGKLKLDAAGRKRIADAMKKRWTERQKAVAKTSAKKAVTA